MQPVEVVQQVEEEEEVVVEGAEVAGPVKASLQIQGCFVTSLEQTERTLLEYYLATSSESLS